MGSNFDKQMPLIFTCTLNFIFCSTDCLGTTFVGVERSNINKNEKYIYICIYSIHRKGGEEESDGMGI